MMAELRVGTPKERVRNEPTGESHVQVQEATEKPEGNSRLPKRKENAMATGCVSSGIHREVKENGEEVTGGRGRRRLEVIKKLGQIVSLEY